MQSSCAALLGKIRVADETHPELLKHSFDLQNMQNDLVCNIRDQNTNKQLRYVLRGFRKYCTSGSLRDKPNAGTPMLLVLQVHS